MASCTACGDEFPLRRYQLGYRKCLVCGDKDAGSITHCIAPLNKSNYVVISNINDLKGLNPKRSEI